MNEEHLLANFSFSAYDWIWMGLLAVGAIVIVKIVSDIIQVEYRVWRSRRKR